MGGFKVSKHIKALIIRTKSTVIQLLLELAHYVVYVRDGSTSCIAGGQQTISSTRGYVKKGKKK
jgi:hypothetical protein